MSEEIEPPENATDGQEEITSPEVATAGDAPPEWLTEARAEQSEPTFAERANSLSEGLDNICVKTVKLVHHRAAQATGFNGWELEEDEMDLWRQIFVWLFKNLPRKEWPVVVVFGAVALLEVSKFMAWRSWAHPKVPK